MTQRNSAFRRYLAAVVALGLLTSLVGAAPALAKTKRKPTTKSQCLRSGWKRYGFKNQGQCVSYVNAHTKKATTTTARTATTTAGSPAAKGTVKLGTIGTSLNSTTGLRTTDETRKIALAWADQVNAAGGINGYKVQVIFKDGRADTARTLQGIRELNEAGVLAVVGQGVAQNISGSTEYIGKNNVPILGGTPYTPEFDYHPMYFPVSSAYYAGVYGQVAAARDVGAKSFLNAFCTEVAGCAQSVPVTKEAAAREGLKFSSQGASAVAADYTAICLSAKQDGVDFFQSNGLNFANVIRDCSRQNYHPTYAQGGAANQSVIDAAKGENVAGNLYEFGAFYNGPEVARYRKAIATTDLNVNGAQETQTAIHAWLGFEMAGAVLKRMTAVNPTRQDFLNALYTIKGETLDGQNQPVDYTVQKPGTGLHAGNDCWTEHIVKDGKLYHMDKSGQTVSKLTFICGTGHKYTTG